MRVPDADFVARLHEWMLRPGAGVVVVLAVLVGGCGGDSGVSLEEYAEEMQQSTDELQAMGEQVNAELEGYVDLETGAIVDAEAVGTLVATIASDLQVYFDELEALEPPSEIEDAHNAFVDAAGTRVEQWESAAAQATEFESVEDLVVATLKSPTFQTACVTLEQAVDDHGPPLDLDCNG